MRSGEWKLLCEYDGSDAELYNILEDPSESQNIANRQAEIVAKMTKAVLAWHQSMPADNGANWSKRKK